MTEGKLTQAKLEEVMERLSASPLTQDQQMALFIREDMGINPVEVNGFEDVESFKVGSNNFFMHFAAIESSDEWHFKRRNEAFQRYAVLNPDVVGELTQRFRGKYPRDYDYDDWISLFGAYQAIAQLVDARDQHVIRNGSVDSYYLCR